MLDGSKLLVQFGGRNNIKQIAFSAMKKKKVVDNLDARKGKTTNLIKVRNPWAVINIVFFVLTNCI